MKTILIGNGYWGSIVRSKLEKYTEILYIANSQDNIERILDKYNYADYIFICTPTPTHYDIAKKCIIRGKNIFCEKPFTGDINRARTLYMMSEKNNTKIFVDNIFLYRKEITNIENREIKEIKFIWNKFEEVFKENLLNTLLYHDLYFLLELTKSKCQYEWNIKSIEISDEKLLLKLSNSLISSEFEYNRGPSYIKEKKILINNDIIDMSTPLNDPLSEILEDLMSNKIDFLYNKILTLDTISLLNKIELF